MSKGSDEDNDGDKLISSDGDGDMSVKQLIASYAGGSENNASVDTTYALQVLKDLGESESTPECVICFGEVFDEVLLPCYHRG